MSESAVGGDPVNFSDPSGLIPFFGQSLVSSFFGATSSLAYGPPTLFGPTDWGFTDSLGPQFLPSPGLDTYGLGNATFTFAMNVASALDNANALLSPSFLGYQSPFSTQAFHAPLAPFIESVSPVQSVFNSDVAEVYRSSTSLETIREVLPQYFENSIDLSYKNVWRGEGLPRLSSTVHENQEVIDAFVERRGFAESRRLLDLLNAGWKIETSTDYYNATIDSGANPPTIGIPPAFAPEGRADILAKAIYDKRVTLNGRGGNIESPSGAFYDALAGHPNVDASFQFLGATGTAAASVYLFGQSGGAATGLAYYGVLAALDQYQAAYRTWLYQDHARNLRAEGLDFLTGSTHTSDVLVGVTDIVYDSATTFALRSPSEVVLSRGAYLRQKYGHLSASERQARIAYLAEANAGRYLERIESLVPNGNGHFFSRHGAGTSLLDQELRAIFGAKPDEASFVIRNNPPSASSRFLSNRDQMHALDRAFGLPSGQPVVFEYPIGEGFLSAFPKSASGQRFAMPFGAQYFQSNQAVFHFNLELGLPVTGFPIPKNP